MPDNFTPALALDAAGDPAHCGGKAAALARARAAGLPVLPGFVLPVGSLPPGHRGAVARVPGATEAWERLSDKGRLPLVVRSSGVAEDAGSSSLAGRFASIVDVRGWPAFESAVDEVLASADGADGGMAVLVQPFVAARYGGVLFGADPVTGNRRHLLLCAAADGPVPVVSGETLGTQYTLTRRGRVLGVREDAGGVRLPDGEVRDLARLARAVEELFGAPQDVEWLRDDDGALWLLQSRPVTTLDEPPRARHRPLLGTGPVAETFPDPLAPLEVDLWVEPLRRGLAEALLLSGAVAPRAVTRSPVVVAVDGQVAVDLTLLDPRLGRRRLSALDPRPPARRLRAAWRVGRLRSALPGLGRAVVTDVDRLLADTPPLSGLSERQLLALLQRTREALAAVHGHEVLAGMLLAESAATGSALAVALRLAAAGRAAGLTDEELVARHPTVLALVPPAVTATVRLPADLPAPPDATGGPRDGAALVREALRLRARWLQELGARAAHELGVRLTARGILGDWAEVRATTLDGLVAAVRTATPPPAAAEPAPSVRPLPATFRLTADGAVVPAQRSAPSGRRRRGTPGGDGVPSGGGRGEGFVHAGPGEPGAGEVLVVATLSPALAPWLPSVAAIVCETGSPLAHLAILAREYGVPAVLAVPDAVRRFPPGRRVRVDGDAGTVELVESEEVTA